MTSKAILIAWRARCATPVGFAQPIAALEAVLRDAGAPEDVKILEAKPDPDSLLPVAKLQPQDAIPKKIWKNIGLRAAIYMADGNRALVNRLAGLLSALYLGESPAVAAYRARGEAFMLYPDGYAGRALTETYLPPPPAGLTHDELRSSLEKLSMSSAAVDVLSSAIDSKSGLLAESLDERKIAAAVESIPWQPFGIRFGRLFGSSGQCRCGDAPFSFITPDPGNHEPEWWLERLASCTRAETLPETWQDEYAIAIDVLNLPAGVLCVVPRSGSAINSEQREMVHLAALALATDWQQEHLTQSRAAAAQKAKETRFQCDLDEEAAAAFASRLWTGVPVLKATARAAGEPVKPPLGLPPDAPDAKLEQVDYKFGKYEVVIEYAVAAGNPRKYWGLWHEAVKEAFELRPHFVDSDAVSLTGWLRSEVLTPHLKTHFEWDKARFEAVQMSGENPCMDTKFVHEIDKVFRWQHQVALLFSHLAQRAKGSDESRTVAEVVIAAAVLARSHSDKGGGTISWKKLKPVTGVTPVTELSSFNQPELLIAGRFSSNVSDESIKIADSVRLAIECAFYIVMKHCTNEEIEVDWARAGEDLRSIQLRFACSEVDAIKDKLQNARLSEYLSQHTGPGATVTATADGPGRVYLQLATGVGGEMVTRLNHEMRFAGPKFGMLFHHGSEARDRWPQYKRYFTRPEAKWDPTTNKRLADSLPMTDAIDNLIAKGGGGLDQSAFDLGGIWNYFEKMGVSENVKLDRATQFSTERFFLYLPEWYEILIDSSREDSLLKEALSRKEDAQVRVALESNDPEAWQWASPLTKPHKLTIWWADNGTGADPDEFVKGYTGHQGKLRDAITRARTNWDAKVSLYSKQPGRAVLVLQTHQEMEPEPLPADKKIPEFIRNHFTKESGFCVSFEMTIGPSTNDAILEELPNWDLGVVVVDGGSHNSVDFGKYHIPVVRTWAEFDDLKVSLFEEIWIHLSDILKTSSGMDEVKAFMNEEGDSVFATRGKRTRTIVVFSGSDFPEDYTKKTWRAGRVLDHLPGEMRVNERLRKEFDIPNVRSRIGSLENDARKGEGDPDELEKYRRRLSALEAFQERLNDGRDNSAVGKAAQS